MGSSVFDWTKIEVKATKSGERRQFFLSPTATLDELECHVTTLNKVKSPMRRINIPRKNSSS